MRARSICGALPPERLADLAAIRRIERLAPGETLAWEGAQSVLVAIVRNGLVKRSVLLADGREQVVGLAFAGDTVGRPFAETSDHGLTAITQTTLCVYTRAAFERFAAANPVFEHAMLVQALDDLSRAQRTMVMLARLSAPQRIATFLLDLLARGDRTPTGQIAIPLGRQQIGDVLGLSIETVSRTLRAFERGGLIGLPGYRTLILRNPGALAAIAGFGGDGVATSGRTQNASPAVECSYGVAPDDR